MLTAQEVLDRGAELGLPDPAASPPLEFEAWPGAERRWPRITHPAALTLRPLSTALARAVRAEAAPAGAQQAVVDVGCGVKPYLPFFAAIAAEYVGVDLVPGPQVDVVGSAESLPLPDERFDIALCTQTLEHVPDPAKAIGELHRVLKPRGLLLLSTHGTAAYHPAPADLWRWTQEGLAKIVGDNGDWSELRLEAAGGTAACFGYLLGFYVGGGVRARAARPVQRALLASINTSFGALDRIVPLHYPRRSTLISNFLVVARKR